MGTRWFHKFTALVRASKIQRLAATGLIVLALLSVAQSNLLVVLQKQVDVMLSAVLPSVIVDLTNEERVAHALTNLKRNPVLDEAARLKATHMRSEEYFAHWSPKGISPWFWFDEVGYDYVHAGENLAIYFDESEDVVEAWMDSPLHRENILRSEYTEIGVAAVRGEYEGYDTVYIVQLFGTPASKVQPVVQRSLSTATSSKTSTSTLAVQQTQPDVTVQGQSVESAEIEPIPEPKSIRAKELPTEAPVSDVEKIVSIPMPEEPTSTPVTVVPMDGGVAYVSDHASTSSGKVAEPVGTAGSFYKGGESMTMPDLQAGDAQSVLQVLYVVLALFVAGLIAVSIIIAEKHLHHTQAALGASLFLVMLALVSFHVNFVHTVSAGF